MKVKQERGLFLVMKRLLITILAFIFITSLAPISGMAAESSVQVLVEPTMDYFIVGSFSEELARVEDNGKCGFMDKTGNIVIPLIYDADRYSDFSEGLALVYKGGHYINASQRIMEGGKCGFIDNTGKVVIPLEYDTATTFSEGLAAVEKNGKQYLIDKSGTIVVALGRHYDDIGLFSDGMARVQIKDQPNSTGYGYGFINRAGEEVIPPGKYELVGWSFSEGLVQVGKFNGDFNQYGFMDKTGTVIIPMDYANVFSFVDGLAIVRPADTLLYGVINKNGKNIIPFEYNSTLPFSSDLFSVRKDDMWGVIDLNGKIVIPLEYDSIGILSEGLASFSKGGKQGYMDKTGKVVISLSGNYEPSMFAGEALSPFHDGFAIVYNQVRASNSIMDMSTYAKWGVIDKTGREVIPLEYDYISHFTDGLAVTFKGYTDFYHRVFIGNWGILQIVEGVDNPSLWAEADISEAIAANLVPKSLQSNYTQTITRSEFCALAVTFYEKFTGEEITERKTFNDTKDVNVEKMAAVGVVSGVGNNLFAPDARLSREQAATILSRLADVVGKPLPKQAATFIDNAVVSPWAIEAVGQVQIAGIMGGIGNNTFAPKGPFTREQSIITIIRLWDNEHP